MKRLDRIFKIVETFVIIGVFLLFVLIIIGGRSPSAPEVTGTASPTVSTAVSVDELRANAVKLTYDDIARYPDVHYGKSVVYTGKVVQKVSDTQYRISITETDLGLWKDTVYVFLRESARNSRILEDDIVEFVGVLRGEQTYRSIFNQRITIPRIDVYEINVVRKR